MVKMSKRSIATLLPSFNATRMVGEYVAKTYLPATRQYRKYCDTAFEGARQISTWKNAVRKAWPSVTIRRLGTPKQSIMFREGVHFEVSVNLNGLKPADVAVEMLIGHVYNKEKLKQSMLYQFAAQEVDTETGEHVYVLELTPELCGKLEYRIRVYPHHEMLTHPFEMGLMRWL